MPNKPATRLVTGKTEVTTAQTAVQLTTGKQEFECLGVFVQADPSNAGVICCVGDKNVNAKKTLGTTRGTVMEKKQEPVFIEISDPAELWVDSDTSKDFVCWTAILA